MNLDDQIELKEQELKKLKLRRAFEVLKNCKPDDIQKAMDKLRREGKIK